MRKLAAVALQEIAARRSVLVLAGVLALGAALCPLLRRSAVPAGEVREVAVLLLVAGFAALAPIVLGATVLVPDLLSGRLAFFLARPVSTATLWLGKLLGVAAIVAAGAVLILLPLAPRLAEEPRSAAGLLGEASAGLHDLALLALGVPAAAIHDDPLPAGWTAVASVAFVLALVAGAHAAALALRARSGWLAADLAGLVAVALLLTDARRVLLAEMAVRPLALAERAFCIALAIATLAAGERSLSRGRMRPERAHRAASLTLWPILLVAAAGLDLAAHRVVAPTRPDFSEVGLAWDATDDWTIVGGRQRGLAGFRVAFAVEAATGRAVRLGGLDLVQRSLAVSADGRTMLRAARQDPRDRPELVVLDLAADEPASRRTKIEVPLEGVGPSPDGRLAAWKEDGLLRVVSLADGRVVAASAGGPARHLRFVGSDRIVAASEDLWELWSLDAATGRLALLTERTGEQLAVTPAGDLHSRRPDRGAVWIDPATGGASPAAAFQGGGLLGFLADGRAIASRFSGGVTDLALLGRDLALVRTWTLPGWRSPMVAGEAAAGRVVLSVFGDLPELPAADLRPPPSSVPGSWSLLLLDADTGELRRIGRGWRSLGHRGAPPAAPGAPLLLAGERRLVRWSPATGEVQDLVTGADVWLFP